MKIRDLLPSDVERAAEITNAHWDGVAMSRAVRQMNDMFADTYGGPHFYVAEVDDAVVGFMGFRRSFIMRGAWEIVWVAVDPKHHGKSIGHALMEYGLNHIGRKHGSLILLMTEIPEFFEDFGFRQTADFNGWSLMVMQLQAVKMS